MDSGTLVVREFTISPPVDGSANDANAECGNPFLTATHPGESKFEPASIWHAMIMVLLHVVAARGNLLGACCGCHDLF